MSNSEISIKNSDGDALVERIHTLADQFSKSGNDTEFPSDFDALLDHENFDDTFVENFKTFQQKCPEIDGMSFKRKLLLEASRYAIEKDEDGKKEITEYNLIAVPISGLHGDLMTLIQDQETFNTFSESFKASGLAAADSRILVYPILLNMFEATNLLPGKVRSILKKTAHSMDVRNTANLADEVRAMLDLDENEFNDAEQVEAVILLVHSAQVSSDIPSRRSFSHNNVDHIMSDQTGSVQLDTWMELLEPLFDGRPMFIAPSTLPRACSALAFAHISMSLSFEAFQRDLSADKVIENLTFRVTPDSVVFSSTADGKRLGDVPVPIPTLMSDIEWIERVLGIGKQDR